MSFYFCNLCGKFPKNKEDPFYLLQCNEILCKLCLTKGSPNVCTLCRKSTKAKKIHDKMPELYGFFAQNPESKMNEVENIDMFQLTQDLNLFKLDNKFEEEYERVLKETAELEAEMKEKNDAYKKEVACIKQLRGLIEKKERNPDASCSFSSSNVSVQSGGSSLDSMSFLSKSSNESFMEPEKGSNSRQLAREKTLPSSSQPKSPKSPMVQGPFSRANTSTNKGNKPVRGNRSIFSQGSQKRPGSSNTNKR